MDSLRPDFLSCYGYDKKTSPNIDRIAHESVVFTNAFAQSTWTRPSGASLLTSTYPSVHGVLTVDDMLPDSLPTLPEQLKQHGFHTIAISAIGNISPDFGFGRGFDRFIELYKDNNLVERRHTIDVRDAGRSLHFRIESNQVPIATSEDINLSLFESLGKKNLHNSFILIWSIDTHSPYFHRDPSLARAIDPSLAIWSPKEIMSMKTENELQRLKLLYEDMVFYNDHFIGKLMEGLQEMKLWEDTMFILTGDHGEAFSEHGVNSHGWGAPFDELVRIPLIMKFPHSEFHGLFDELVQEIDIAPTILDYLSLKNTGQFWQGRSVMPIIQSRKEINSVVFVEAQHRPELPSFTAVRTKEYKYIELTPGKLQRKGLAKEFRQRLIWLAAKPRMLFDMQNDPLEKQNIAKTEKETMDRLRIHMKDFKEQCKKITLGGDLFRRERRDIDKDVAKQLNALGYFD